VVGISELCFATCKDHVAVRAVLS